MDQDMMLPNGQYFESWEKEQKYSRELHVNGNHPGASDKNDGTYDHPLKTINAAAQLADPGTRVLIHEGVYRECVAPERGGSGGWNDYI